MLNNSVKTTIAKLEDEYSHSFAHRDPYCVIEECLQTIRTLLGMNEKMEKVLVILSKRQIATWYPLTQLPGDKGHYAGWDDAEYLIKTTLSNNRKMMEE